MTNYCKLVLLNAKTTNFSYCCPPVMSVPKLRLHLEVAMKIARFKRFVPLVYILDAVQIGLIVR
jgi:hypothetical protein